MLRLLLISALLCAVCVPAHLNAQDDDISLGDLARELRKYKAPDESEIIDNDNLTRVMDKAESERLEGQSIFSVSRSGILTTISPDGACSLSFDARSIGRNAAAFIATDLPQDELAKLDGPAVIQDGQLVVSVHNRTQWELKEIVVSLTVLQAQSAPAEYRFATLDLPSTVVPEKLPDATVLLHLKGNGPTESTAVFRYPLDKNFELSKDWHWSIVAARGIPPAAPVSRPLQSAAVDSLVNSAVSNDGSGQGASPSQLSYSGISQAPNK